MPVVNINPSATARKAKMVVPVSPKKSKVAWPMYMPRSPPLYSYADPSIDWSVNRNSSKQTARQKSASPPSRGHHDCIRT